MKEILIKDKQNYLNENYPFEDIPLLTDKKHCLHCDRDIVVGNFKVFLKDGEEYICCPNAPECDGTIIDWIEIE